jgi:hypothetical protein
MPGATEILPVIHFVAVERLRSDPDALVTACGSWNGGSDWSTNRAAVSCPGCLARCGLAHVGGAASARVPSPARPRR